MVTKKRISKLITDFMAAYPSKWKESVPDEESYLRACMVWYEALSDLDGSAIDYAYKNAVTTLEWPPSIAEFRKIALKIEKPSKAFTKAILGNSEYAQLLISWDWKNLQENELRTKFYAAYDEYIEKKLTKKDEQDLIENKIN